MRKLSRLEKVGACFLIYLALAIPLALLLIAMEEFGASERSIRLVGGALTYSLLGLGVWMGWNVQSICDRLADFLQRSHPR